MTQTMLANVLIVCGLIGTGVLQHFGFVNGPTASFIFGALTGGAVTSGTLTITKGASVLSKSAPTTKGPN